MIEKSLAMIEKSPAIGWAMKMKERCLDRPSGLSLEAGTLPYVAGAHAGAHVVGVRGIWKP